MTISKQLKLLKHCFYCQVIFATETMDHHPISELHSRQDRGGVRLRNEVCLLYTLQKTKKRKQKPVP